MISLNQFKSLPVLITNKHALGEVIIKSNNIIQSPIDKDKLYKKIERSNSRKIYTNKDLDVTFIEIYLNKDRINDYLDIDNYKNKIYKDEEVYISQYPNGSKV